MFLEPIIGERFFGRQEILDLLSKRALALKDGYRQNIAFTGQSLAGKTSILHNFLYSIKDDDFIAIYIEIIKEPFTSFVNRFVATLLYNALAKIGVDVSVDFQTLLEKAQKSLPKTYQAIRQVNSLIDKDETDNAYANLLGITSVVKEEIEMPCIVILDEFDNLEHLGVKNPFLNFGKMIMVQKDTMYIVTSSRNQAIKKILSEKLSLLFGNFEIVKVAGFDLTTALDFITTRLAGFEIDDLMKRFLIAFTEGNPFYLQHLIDSARTLATARLSNYIDTAVVARAIVDEVYNSRGTIHQYLLNFTLELIDSRYRENHTAILTAIAHGRNKQHDIARSLRAKQGEISKSLVRLMELGLISKNGVFYTIDDVMLEYWLRFVRQKKSELLVDDIFNKMRFFEDEARAYVASFLEELNNDIVSTIASLFNRFSNELVPIDARQMKLPHFTKVETKTFANACRYIAATFRGSSWIVQPFDRFVLENDVIDFVKNAKASGYKISNKIIVPLKGIDENARLLAKELRIGIWEMPTVNMLLGLYGKKRFAIL